jgi:hypothetical protein
MAGHPYSSKNYCSDRAVVSFKDGIKSRNFKTYDLFLLVNKMHPIGLELMNSTPTLFLWGRNPKNIY